MPTQTNPPMRRCTRCGAEKPATLEFFHRSAQGKYGLCSMCKPCNCAHAKEHRDAHLEESREASRRYRAEHLEECQRRERSYHDAHKEERSEQKRRAYAADPGPIRARVRESRRADPEKHKAEVRLWRMRNPEKRRAQSLIDAHRRRAREFAALGSHTVSDVENQHARQKGRCYWCQRKVGDDYHVDHVVPLALGGIDGPENLVVACPSCNCSKGAKHPQEFAGILC